MLNNIIINNNNDKHYCSAISNAVQCITKIISNLFSRLSRNSEVDAMLPLYYIDSNVIIRLESLVTHWYVTRSVRVKFSTGCVEPRYAQLMFV